VPLNFAIFVPDEPRTNDRFGRAAPSSMLPGPVEASYIYSRRCIVADCGKFRGRERIAPAKGADTVDLSDYPNEGRAGARRHCVF
jgi:hypothetical protein